MFDVLVGIKPLARRPHLTGGVAGVVLERRARRFLPTETPLIQMIGRAARNVDGQVVMYAIG